MYKKDILRASVVEYLTYIGVSGENVIYQNENIWLTQNNDEFVI